MRYLEKFDIFKLFRPSLFKNNSDGTIVKNINGINCSIASFFDNPSGSDKIINSLLGVISKLSKRYYLLGNMVRFRKKDAAYYMTFKFSDSMDSRLPKDIADSILSDVRSSFKKYNLEYFVESDYITFSILYYVRRQSATFG
jgi:hypothetical protein